VAEPTTVAAHDAAGGDAPITLPGDHYIAMLSLELTVEGTSATGVAPVRPELLAPRTRRIRGGLLATMVDIVAGHCPNGPVGPTLDLRVQVLSPGPSSGSVHLVCRPLRVGKRLIVSETLVYAGAPRGEPFARALSTFMNNPFGDDVLMGPKPLLGMNATSFDTFLGYRIRDTESVELDPQLRLANGPQGTVQGGVQALLAEIAAEHALGDGVAHVATDLDIRYLNKVEAGPVVATAQRVASADAALRARVTLRDAGHGDRIISYVAVTLEPALEA
jgi:acyl-coenzyme A thioesterase PaaI-like protein